MNAFGDYLYTLRKQRGLTQKTLAEQLKVTDKAVSKWETGEAFPSTEQLAPLADILGVTVDELLRGRFAEKQEQAMSHSKTLSPWFTAGAAILLAVCSLVFVFFIGVSGMQSFTVLDYFYHIYVRMINIDRGDLSSAILWATSLIGTAISIGAIVSVAVFAVITIVRAVKMLCGKQTKLVKSAVFCYFCYVLGCILFHTHWRVTVTLSDAYYSLALNSVSVTGLIVGATLLVALLALTLSRTHLQCSLVDVAHLTAQIVFTITTLCIFASPIRNVQNEQLEFSFSSAMMIRLYAYLFDQVGAIAYMRYDGIVFALVVYLITILLLVFLTVKLASLTESICHAANKSTLGIDGALCVIMIAYLSFKNHPVSLIADLIVAVPSSDSMIAGYVFICLMFVFSLAQMIAKQLLQRKKKDNCKLKQKIS